MLDIGPKFCLVHAIRIFSILKLFVLYVQVFKMISLNGDGQMTSSANSDHTAPLEVDDMGLHYSSMSVQMCRGNK